MMIEVREITDYDFKNNIEINSINDALIWLSKNIEYKSDKKEYWQTPEETYNLGTGDCEDFAIMFAYLLYTKLNIKDIDLVRAKYLKEQEIHVFNYIGEDINKFIEPQAYYLTEETVNRCYDIINFIPYTEAIWMTINYHHRVGKYI